MRVARIREANARMTDDYEITRDTPLRLADAVKLAFPCGGMTVSGLRREIARGNLAIEMIAGKQFTTLRDIEKMRLKCRENQRAPASISANAADVNPSTSSSMERRDRHRLRPRSSGRC